MSLALPKIENNTFIIQGGRRLEGHLKAPGAKNSITKLLIASLLSKEKTILENVPNIDEVEITISLLSSIGSEINWDKEKKIIEIETKEIHTTYIPQQFSGANRIPILLLGVLLGSTLKEIVIPTVGGCKIGQRPINFHLEALKTLGAEFEHQQLEEEIVYIARAPSGLKGGEITLPYPSLGASENALLAACKAQGISLIHNIALEPEFFDLIYFLQKMGFLISFEKDRTIKVQGTKETLPVVHSVIADRASIASFAMAALATKGRIFIEGARQDHLLPFLTLLRKMRAGIDIRHNGILFSYEGPLQGGHLIDTAPSPGFLTDMQQPLVALLTQAKGFSVIHETVYESRFGYTHALKEMGADLDLFEECLSPTSCRFHHKGHLHSLVVKGATPLIGKEIIIPDLRGGFAYLLAALIAEGETRLSNIHYLKRGYEHLEMQLQELGADISEGLFNV